MVAQTQKKNKMETITLTNGKKVANFSSPHEFKFEDGTVLPAVSEEVSRSLSVDFIEKEDGNGDIHLSFQLSLNCAIAVEEWEEKWRNKEVHVVFCPLPMITALKANNYNLKNSPFRSIRVVDRISKLVSIHKQCL
jgi:hypothetical protein